MLGLSYSTSFTRTSMGAGDVEMVPVLTVFKNNGILKNIFLLGSSSPTSITESKSENLDYESVLLIGRNPDCDIVLQHPCVSRFHLRVYVRSFEQKLYLVDLSSVHGTWISDRKIEPGIRSELTGGESFRVGGSTRVYKLQWMSVDSAHDLENSIVPSGYKREGKFPRVTHPKIEDVISRSSSKIESEISMTGSLISESTEKVESETSTGMIRSLFLNDDHISSDSPKNIELETSINLLSSFTVESETSNELNIKTFPASSYDPTEYYEVKQLPNSVESESSSLQFQNKIFLNNEEQILPSSPTNFNQNTEEEQSTSEENESFSSGRSTWIEEEEEEEETYDEQTDISITEKNEENEEEIINEEDKIDTEIDKNCIEDDEQTEKEGDCEKIETEIYKSGMKNDEKTDLCIFTEPENGGKEEGCVFSKNLLQKTEEEEELEMLKEVTNIRNGSEIGQKRKREKGFITPHKKNMLPCNTTTMGDEVQNIDPKSIPRAEVIPIQPFPKSLQTESQPLLSGAHAPLWLLVVDTTTLLCENSRNSLRLIQGLRRTRLLIPRSVLKDLDSSTDPTYSSALQWVEETIARAPWWVIIEPRVDVHGKPDREEDVLEFALRIGESSHRDRLILLSDDSILTAKVENHKILLETAERFQRSIANPFSDRFMWPGSTPRGRRWTYLDDAYLKSLYGEKARVGGNGVSEGLRHLILS